MSYADVQAVGAHFINDPALAGFVEAARRITMQARERIIHDTIESVLGDVLPDDPCDVMDVLEKRGITATIICPRAARDMFELRRGTEVLVCVVLP